MKHMTSILLATVAGVGLMSSAYAADLIIEEPVAEVGVVDVGNWDGVFVGAFVGYGWGTLTDEEDYFDTPGEDYESTGWLLGVDAGANFTFAEALVAGIVADIAWSNISGEDATDFVAYNIDWLGSVRGRLGFDGGAFLPYITAGLAFANNTITDDTGVATVEDTATHIGWTAGVGVEFAATENVSIDLLYRFSDYGAQDYVLDAGTSSFSLATHTVQAGVHFRF